MRHNQSNRDLKRQKQLRELREIERKIKEVDRALEKLDEIEKILLAERKKVEERENTKRKH